MNGVVGHVRRFGHGPRDAEREEERQRAAQFFGKSSKTEEGPEHPTPAPPQRRGRHPPAPLPPIVRSALSRQVGAARIYAKLRWLLLPVLAFSGWQLYLWWNESRPTPILAGAQLRQTATGYAISFTVVNHGGAGSVEITPQLILESGRIVSGSPLPLSQSYFHKGEAKQFRVEMPLPGNEPPKACTVQLRPSLVGGR